MFISKFWTAIWSTFKILRCSYMRIIYFLQQLTKYTEVTLIHLCKIQMKEQTLLLLFFFWMRNIFFNFSPPSLSYLSILLYDHFLIRISKHLIDSSKKNVFSINLFYFYIKYKPEKIKKADCRQSNMPIWTFCNSSKLNKLFLFYSFSITSQPHLKMVTISTYDPIKMKIFTVTGPR